MITRLSERHRRCDIVIPVWNKLEVTRECLNSIFENTEYPFKVIIVDNGSGEDTRICLDEFARKYPDRVYVLRNEQNEGFIKAVNMGMRRTEAHYVCIMNNDTIPGEKWLSGLVEFAEAKNDVGLLNPLCSGHEAQGLSVNEYARRIAGNRKTFMEMNQCQGFCMLIKREVIDIIGYLDERFGIGGFDDTDYSMRAYHAGYKSVCVHSAYVYHKEHTSFDTLGRRKDIQASSEKEYFKKWPRHMRVLLTFSIGPATGKKELENFLQTLLYLAREWCWVNALIFGGEDIKEMFRDAVERISFPQHQNIKFSYFVNRFKNIEVVVRILERSFGSKRRKKYDAVICDEAKIMPFLKIVSGFQKSSVLGMDFRNIDEALLKKTVSVIRKNEKMGTVPKEHPQKGQGTVPIF